MIVPAAGVISNNTVTEADVLVQAGHVHVVAMHAINTTAAAAFVQYFDAAAVADVTVGTTVPVWVLRSPASSVSDGDGLPTHGLLFKLGVVIASTTTPTGNTGAAQHVRTAII